MALFNFRCNRGASDRRRMSDRSMGRCFSHGSENSIRLLGKEFIDIPNRERKGYTRGSVIIGDYTFVGARSLVLPGVKIGRGCLIGSGTLVKEDIPDYSIVMGQPGKVKGSTIALDEEYFRDCDYSDTYYDSKMLEEIKRKLNKAL